MKNSAVLETLPEKIESNRKTILEETTNRDCKSDFAFVIHTTDINLLSIALNMPWLPYVPQSILKKIFEWLPPFKCSHITGITSLTGRRIEGDLMFCPLLPEQILNLNQDIVLKKIIKAGEIAKKNGAKILGLGAYTAQVGKRGVLVAKGLNMPVTTGSSYTAAVTLDAIFEAARKMHIQLPESKVAIIGATGGIGKVCSQILASHVQHIVLIARNQERLNNLAKSIYEENESITVETATNISDKNISDCDIIIIVTNDPTLLIDIKNLKSGAVVCDVSQPPNISKQDRELRKDILTIDGGIVKPSGDVDFNFYFGLPPGLAFACMAETMILALEEKYESFSIGGNISTDKVMEISQLAAKHGFVLAELKNLGKPVLNEEIASVRKYIQATYSYA
jgi:predicted amino acid dehydrogenase